MNGAKPRIVVLGSLNMDLVLRVPRAPEAGETLTGHTLDALPGGKGGNQAVACARQGADVALIGRVGDDDHGRALVAALRADGIDVRGVETDASVATGTALVMVDDAGQNRIVVLGGANAQCAPDDAALDAALRGADALLLQLEVPLPTVLCAIDAAARAGCPVLLNPSPVQPLPADVWPRIDTLVVNEVEAAALCAHAVADVPSAAAAARHLMALGVRRVVVTLGALGAVAADATGLRHHLALPLVPVDTTAAGDSFTGALAVALAAGGGFDAAVAQGTRAAALCVLRVGAQPAIPHAQELAAMPVPAAPLPL